MNKISCKSTQVTNIHAVSVAISFHVLRHTHTVYAYILPEWTRSSTQCTAFSVLLKGIQVVTVYKVLY